MNIKINTPKTPTPDRLPKDSRAAWSNGFRSCATALEQALDESFLHMGLRSQRMLIKALERHLRARRTTRSSRIAREMMSCGHALMEIALIPDTEERICTLCGLR